MNKIILTLALAMTMGFAACAQNKGENNMQTDNKTLVVYFSATGTTAKAAGRLWTLQVVLYTRLFRNKPTLPMTLIGTTGSRAVRRK